MDCLFILSFEQCDGQYIRQHEKNDYTDKADCHAQVKVFYNKSHDCIVCHSGPNSEHDQQDNQNEHHRKSCIDTQPIVRWQNKGEEQQHNAERGYRQEKIKPILICRKAEIGNGVYYKCNAQSNGSTDPCEGIPAGNDLLFGKWQSNGIFTPFPLFIGVCKRSRIVAMSFC